MNVKSGLENRIEQRDSWPPLPLDLPGAVEDTTASCHLLEGTMWLPEEFAISVMGWMIY